jgi:hypothetical protein
MSPSEASGQYNVPRGLNKGVSGSPNDLLQLNLLQLTGPA